jgi:hypothetical protein
MVDADVSFSVVPFTSTFNFGTGGTKPVAPREIRFLRDFECLKELRKPTEPAVVEPDGDWISGIIGDCIPFGGSNLIGGFGRGAVGEGGGEASEISFLTAGKTGEGDPGSIVIGTAGEDGSAFIAADGSSTPCSGLSGCSPRASRSTSTA